MKSSPRGSVSLPHTESIHVDASEIDRARSPHALDAQDPNYDPLDDEEDLYPVDFYMTEETGNLGTVPYHVVQRSKGGPSVDRFKMPMKRVSSPPRISMKQFKMSLEGALEELFTSSDFAQFISRLESLECRPYHDELIAHIIRCSLDFTDSDRDKVAELITLMRKSGHVSTGQLSRAFEKLLLTWEDILIDVPSAVEMILRFLELSIADGCLPDTFLARLPEPFLYRISRDLNSEETFTELGNQLSELQLFKKNCDHILNDCFAAAEPQISSNVIASIISAGRPHLRHELVRRAINMSLDKKDSDRELVSSLLLSLRDARILTEDDLLWGFSHLIGSLPDLQLDCPLAIRLVKNYLIRAIADEILPPSFLENAIRLGLGGSEGAEAAQEAKNELDNSSVEWADLRNVWGEDSKWRNDLDIALNEYFDSHDKAEMCRLMREWALCTGKAVILIKKALLKAMDGNGNDCLAVVELLDYAVKHEELKDSDILRAMQQLDENLEDLKLDIPDAPEMLNTFGGLLRNKGLLMTPSPRASPRA